MRTRKTYIPGRPRSEKLVAGGASASGGALRSEIGQIAGATHSHHNQSILDRITLEMVEAATRVLITSADNSTELTDENMLSALRVLVEISKGIEKNNKLLKELFLSKVEEDTAAKTITFLDGLISNEQAILEQGARSRVFFPGIFGEGFNLEVIPGTQNQFQLTLHKINARILEVDEIVTRRWTWVGAGTIMSAAGFEIDRVEELPTTWRVYPSKPEENDFIRFDQALCQSFRTDGTSAQSKRYWRLVTAVADDRSWIELSKTDRELSSNGIPEAGDSIIQLGHRTNVARQNAIVLSSFGATGPFFQSLRGINSFDTSGRTQMFLGNESVFNVDRLAINAGNGQFVQVPADKGRWIAGTPYFFNNRVSHKGKYWLCITHAKLGTFAEPSETSIEWELQVWAEPGEPGQQGERGVSLPDGLLLNRDPEFRNGLNGYGVYNNAGGTAVRITRVARPADAPTTSSHIMRYSFVGGATSPNFGGFSRFTMSRANAVFVHRIIAKIPVGYDIMNNENAVGDNPRHEWLTSRAGTGRYEEYLYRLTSGATGVFSDFGYISFEPRTAANQNIPFDVDVAFAGISDLTSHNNVADIALSTAHSAGLEINTLRGTVNIHASQIITATNNITGLTQEVSRAHTLIAQNADSIRLTASNINNKIDGWRFDAHNYFSLAALENGIISGTMRRVVISGLLPNTDYIVGTNAPIVVNEAANSRLVFATTGAGSIAEQNELNGVSINLPRVVRSDALGRITVTARDLFNAPPDAPPASRFLDGTYSIWVFRGNTMPEDITTRVRKTESEILLMPSKISLQVRNEIQGSGTNLLRNSNRFRYAGSAAGITGSVTNGVLRVISSAGNGNWLSLIGLSLDDSGLHEGDLITMSFWARSDNSAHIPAFFLKEGMGYFAMNGRMSSRFSQFFVTVPYRLANNVSVHLGFFGRVGTFYIKNIQVERGNLATAWSLHPDDVSTQLLATGIDITNQNIILRADRVKFLPRTGNVEKIWIDPEDGRLRAIDVDLSGRISANSGVIGGFTIETGRITRTINTPGWTSPSGNLVAHNTATMSLEGGGIDFRSQDVHGAIFNVNLNANGLRLERSHAGIRSGLNFTSRGILMMQSFISGLGVETGMISNTMSINRHEERVYFICNNATPITITLPSPVDVPNRVYFFRRINAAVTLGCTIPNAFQRNGAANTVPVGAGSGDLAILVSAGGFWCYNYMPR